MKVETIYPTYVWKEQEKKACVEEHFQSRIQIGFVFVQYFKYTLPYFLLLYSYHKQSMYCMHFFNRVEI